jgi:hypothetical protein
VTYDTEHASTEADFDWFLETGEIGMSMPDDKYVSRILIRMEANSTGTIAIAFEYDSSGSWVDTFTLSNAVGALGTKKVPLIPRRCDHMRIKITGKGNAKIYSLTKTVEQGSDY